MGKKPQHGCKQNVRSDGTNEPLAQEYTSRRHDSSLGNVIVVVTLVVRIVILVTLTFSSSTPDQTAVGPNQSLNPQTHRRIAQPRKEKPAKAKAKAGADPDPAAEPDPWICEECGQAGIAGA